MSANQLVPVGIRPPDGPVHRGPAAAVSPARRGKLLEVMVPSVGS
jgi:hypothetical protein